MSKIKIIFKSIFNVKFYYLALLLLLFVYPVYGQTAEVMQRGDAFVVYLSGKYNFADVVRHLESEVAGENWQIVNQMDVGESVRELGKETDNQVISVCKIQYLAQAIEEDPFISLIIPCRFTVFRESGKDGRIVVGFYDPVAEAKALNLKQAGAAEIARKELKAILHRVAEFFQE